MNLDLQVIDLARELLLTVVIIAAPVLIVGLIVGVSVSLFQALTSVQEQTMSLIPKMFAVIMVALLMLAPALGLLRDYATRVFEQLNTFGLS
ncbi:MAG: flagellar biosynthetic protein FliQ [Planctomycetota bacterium]|nr:flagellar biosynthetic protein FliQ [Planctomycetota bacterium]